MQSDGTPIGGASSAGSGGATRAREDDSTVASDLDPDGFSQGSSAKSRRTWCRDGPKDLSAVLRVNHDAAEHMVKHAIHSGDETMMQSMISWCKRDRVVTSNFSGLLSYEMAVLFSLQDLAEALKVRPGNIVFYSACENDPVAQGAIKENRHVKVQHLFKDCEDFMFDYDREEVNQIVADQMEQYACLVEELKLHGITKQHHNLEAEKLSRTTLELLKAKFETMEFQDCAPCLIHGKDCFISPRAHRAYRNMYWQDGGGTVCCPFSTMSNTPHWCDKSTVSTLCHVYSRRYFEPNELDHECVLPFEVGVFAEILARTDGIPKSIHCKDVADDESYKGYGVLSNCFSPADLGVPASRPRRYSKFKLLTDGEVVTMKCSLCFEGLFYRQLHLNASIYLVIPSEIELAEVTELMSRPRRKLARAGSDPTHGPQAVDLSSSGDFHRKEGYLVKAAKLALCDSEGNNWKPDVAIVNLQQNSEFMKMISTGTAPGLMRKSSLFDLVKNKRVPIAASWLISGFPRPGLGTQFGHHVDGRFPLVGCLVNSSAEFGSAGKISLENQGFLLGNVMHVAQIGHWVLYGSLV